MTTPLQNYESPIAFDDEKALRVLRAARFVRDTFARDLEAGYKTRDKTFAVDILGHALRDDVPKPQDAPHDIELLVFEKDGSYCIVKWFDDGFLPPCFRCTATQDPVEFTDWWPLPPTRR